jgi:hypothetical protein
MLTMTCLEQFTHILENKRKNDVLPFLKELSLDQRKELSPHIKKLSKVYFEYYEVKDGKYGSWRQKATPEQGTILRLAAFVCYTRKEFEKEAGVHIISDPMARQILDWYCPDWYSDYINHLATTDSFYYGWSYEWMMEQAAHGFIVPSPKLIVRLLPQAIFHYQDDKVRTWSFRIEALFKRQTTLEQHLWYLFDYESNINWTSQNITLGPESTATKEVGWIDVLKTLSEQSKISRERLLKEAMLATTRNFNKTLSGWFAELFIQLEPSKEEILRLQNELFIAFNSPHSKPVNTALSYLKKVADDKAFNISLFLDNGSLLLASETKSVVTSTLQILEILAKTHPDKREEICNAACQAFIHKDESVQTKAAKLIGKYSQSSDEALVQTIAQYYDSMLVSTKGLLGDFAPTENAEAPIAEQSFETLELAFSISPEREIPAIENFDELLFLTSQAFDNNEAYHLDLLPAALIHLQHEVTGDNIAKLEPAFQRAYKLFMRGSQSQNGQLDDLLAAFFIDYGKLLMKEFPVEALSIKELHEKNVKKDEVNKGQWSYCHLKSAKLSDWKTHNNDVIYEPFKQLLLAALAKLKAKSTLSLLSTPTHTPAWIDPLVLVDRLKQQQASEISPDLMDLQIALSRCALENKEAALESAKQELSGEYRNLVQFLFDENTAPQGPFHWEPAWIVAALTKNPAKTYREFDAFSDQPLSRNYLTGQFNWHTVAEESSYDQYDYELRKSIQVPVTHKVLRLEIENKKKSVSEAAQTDSPDAPVSPEQDKLLYAFVNFKEYYPHLIENDMKRLLLLTPHNPEPLLAQIIHRSLTYSTHGDDSKKLITNTLETLVDTWSSFGEMADLFIATCMLSSDKTIRAFAAEIWMNGVTTGTIQSELLGEIIGKHESIEYAPLKRFTDLISDTMFQVSSQHNRELEKMLVSIFYQLPSSPITNLKKLLEIFQEVISVNKTSISDPKLIAQLEAWQASASLSKVVKGLKGKIK